MQQSFVKTLEHTCTQKGVTPRVIHSQGDPVCCFSHLQPPRDIMCMSVHGTHYRYVLTAPDTKLTLSCLIYFFSHVFHFRLYFQHSGWLLRCISVLLICSTKFQSFFFLIIFTQDFYLSGTCGDQLKTKNVLMIRLSGRYVIKITFLSLHWKTRL